MTLALFRGQISEADLRRLRVFKSIVDCGGFTAAEVRLNRSKSAISTDIADLEQRLKVRLCRRGRSGFALTHQGEQIYLAVADLLADVDRFRDKVNRARQHLSGELVICVADNTVAHDQSPLVDTVAEFARRHPEVFLNISSAPAYEVELALLNGRADLGVSLLVRSPPSLETIPLFEEVVELYCGERHAFFSAPEESLTLERIAEARIIEILSMADPAFAKLVERHFTFAARSSTIDSRVIMILSGEYLGFVPPAYARPWVERGEMRSIRPDLLRTANPFYAVFSRAAPANLILEEFRNMLLAAYRVPERAERRAAVEGQRATSP
jgi:LysR family transcriptional regulator, transcriptional activator for bauABCD operon